MNAKPMVYTVLLFTLLFAVAPLAAQTELVTVPDLTGMNVPQAAAALNRAGLRLGVQTAAGWNVESGVPENTISGQSVASGEQVVRGAAIDVTVLRSANVRLIYDDNDLTLVNLSTELIDLRGVTFTVVEGSSASFAATRWANDLRGAQCVQVWSVGRNGPKEVEGCESIQAWLVTNNPAEHFWTQTGGALRFSVVQDGVERAVCDAAPPNSQDQPVQCDLFLSSAVAAETTPYIYFAYTVSALAVINTSVDRWMPLGQAVVINNNPNLTVPGATLTLGDATLFGSPDIVANIALLAPGQCLLFTDSSADVDAPQACDVIAGLDVAPMLTFWSVDFQYVSLSDGQRRACPAATPERLTLCVLPR